MTLIWIQKHHWCQRIQFILLVLSLIVSKTHGFTGFLRALAASNDNIAEPQPNKVLVTGASGKTGRLVLKKLERDPRYEAKALVRSEASAKKLMKDPDINCPLEHIVISDITSPTFEDDSPKGLGNQHGEFAAMIICTSAVPRISRASLFTSIVKVPFNFIRRKKLINFRDLSFKWRYGGYPEIVDYHGQIKQINLAKKLGMPQVIVVSSMGGTDPTNFLNMVGKNKDGEGNGDILLWKRKAEKYLIESGLDYTIIHPGGLVDTPGGQERFLLDVDDKLLSRKRTRISREDVAELCVSALDVCRDQKVSLDCITVEVGDEPNGAKVSAPESAEKALSAFLELAKTNNYALEP